MAQKVVTSLQDDLDGTPASETLRFALAGAEFEIDLSEHNASMFRQRITPFIEHARRSGKTTKARATGRGAADRQRTADIRAWAREQGMDINERGRIPTSIIQQYGAATRS